MKKKLHKTGTTILLALAPACALGVVGGIVLSSLNKGDVEKSVELKLSDKKPEYLEIVASELTTKSTQLDLSITSADYYDLEIKFHLVNENGVIVVEPQSFTIKNGSNSISLIIPQDALKDSNSVTLVSETTITASIGPSAMIGAEIREISKVTSLSKVVSFWVVNDSPLDVTVKLYATQSYFNDSISEEKTATIPGGQTIYVTLTFVEGALTDLTRILVWATQNI